METNELYTKLTSVFHDVFEDEGLVVVPQMSANDVDGWDSLNHLRLVLSVQKAFGVKFSAHEIAQLKNVGDLASLIQAKV